MKNAGALRNRIFGNSNRPVGRVRAVVRGVALLILLSASALTVTGWVWSHVGSFEVQYSKSKGTGWWLRGSYNGHNWGAHGTRGVFGFGISSLDKPCPIWRQMSQWGPYESRYGQFRIKTQGSTIKTTYSISFFCPFWFPFLLFVAYPAYALSRPYVIARRRRKRNLCVTCAYSLVGNESGTCPECGTRTE